MLLLAAISLIWVFERSFEEEVGVDRFIDAAVVWPRSLFFCALATAVAAAIYMLERRNGTLLATGAPSSDDESAALSESLVEEPAPTG